MSDQLSKVVRTIALEMKAHRNMGSRIEELDSWSRQLNEAIEAAAAPVEVDVNAAASNLNLAAVHAKPEHKAIIVDAIGTIRTLARQLAEAKADNERLSDLLRFDKDVMTAFANELKAAGCGVQTEPYRVTNHRAEQAESALAAARKEVQFLRSHRPAARRITELEAELAAATRRVAEVEDHAKEVHDSLALPGEHLTRAAVLARIVTLVERAREAG